MGRDREEHVDMVPSQTSFDDMHTQLGAGLPDDHPQPLSHRAMQDLVSIFRHPNDMKPVVESRMRAGRIPHDLLSRILKPFRPSGGLQNPGEKIITRFAEADRLEAGGLCPIGGK